LLKLLASTPLVTLALIHTYLQIGDGGEIGIANRFNAMRAMPEKPFKRFRSFTNVSDTQLKQGVNEKLLAKPPLQVTREEWISRKCRKND